MSFEALMWTSNCIISMCGVWYSWTFVLQGKMVPPPLPSNLGGPTYSQVELRLCKYGIWDEAIHYNFFILGHCNAVALLQSTHLLAVIMPTDVHVVQYELPSMVCNFGELGHRLSGANNRSSPWPSHGVWSLWCVHMDDTRNVCASGCSSSQHSVRS